MAGKLPYKPFGILRFVLALMVLSQHFCGDIAPDFIKKTVFPWAPGNVAVLAFFIMSGFIICEAYHYNYQDRPIAYIKNRLLRIVPAYWAALIVSILIHLCILQYYGHLANLDRQTIGASYFHANNIIRNFTAIFLPLHTEETLSRYPFIPYAWALQVEMMFYFTVFLVGYGYKFIKPYTNLPQTYWLALAGYAGIIAALITQAGWLPNRFEYGSYFAFGGALFFFLNGHRKALFVLLPAFAQMIWHFRDYSASDFNVVAAYRPGQFLLMAIILVGIVVLATAHIRHTQADKRFGELSYPLYLNHYVMVIVIFNTVSRFSIGYMVLGLIGSLILTEIMFVAVEKPLIKVRQRIRQKSIASN